MSSTNSLLTLVENLEKCIRDWQEWTSILEVDGRDSASGRGATRMMYRRLGELCFDVQSGSQLALEEAGEDAGSLKIWEDLHALTADGTLALIDRLERDEPENSFDDVARVQMLIQRYRLILVRGGVNLDRGSFVSARR